MRAMQNIFYNAALRDWLEKIFIALTIDYIFLFGLESVLPGFVMGVFNLNYLLMAVMALLLVLAMHQSPDRQNQPMSGLSKALIIVLAAYLLVVSGISMYKAGDWQIVVYGLLAAAGNWLLYRCLQTES